MEDYNNSSLATLTYEWFIKTSMDEVDRFISNLDECESKGGLSQSDIDHKLITHMSTYINKKVDNMKVHDVINLFNHFHTEIMVDVDPSMSSTDRIVLLKLFLIKRVEFELSLQFA